MTAPLVRTLREHAPQSWPLWAGMGATLLAVFISLGPATWWQGQAEDLLAATGRERTEAAVPSDRGVVRETPPVLPDAAASPERSARLARLARRQGIQVQRMREQWDPAGQLQVSLAGRGRYALWRTFVSEALAADPALALDRLRLQRPDGEAADLDVETQWTLLHRDAIQSPDSRNRREPLQ